MPFSHRDAGLRYRVAVPLRPNHFRNCAATNSAPLCEPLYSVMLCSMIVSARTSITLPLLILHRTSIAIA